MKSGDFLELALEGRVTAEHVLMLVKHRTREDQLFDYKSGLFFEKEADRQPKPGHPTDAAGKVRKWMAGFANAEGGALVVGVTDSKAQPPWHIDGCSPDADRIDWIVRLLRDFIAYLPSPPRAMQLEVDGKSVYVVAVPRAVNLIALSEQKELVHYLRFGESTTAIPPYLLADLTLGRRQRANVCFDVAVVPSSGAMWKQGQPSVVAIKFDWENVGLSSLPPQSLGCIHLTEGALPIAGGLQRYVELVRYDGYRRGELACAVQTTPALSPFSALHRQVEITLPYIAEGAHVRCVAFLAAEDQPRLVQITFSWAWGQVRAAECRPLAPGALGEVSVAKA